MYRAFVNLGNLGCCAYFLRSCKICRAKFFKEEILRKHEIERKCTLVASSKNLEMAKLRVKALKLDVEREALKLDVERAKFQFLVGADLERAKFLVGADLERAKLLVDAAKSANAVANNTAQSTCTVTNSTAQGGTKTIQRLIEVLGAGIKYAEVTLPTAAQLSNVFEKSTSEVDEVEYDTDEEDGVRVLQIQGGRGVFEKSTSHVDEVEYDTAEEEEESFFILQLLQQKEQIPPSQVLDLFSVRSSILLDHWIHPRATRQTHFSVCSL